MMEKSTHKRVNHTHSQNPYFPRREKPIFKEYMKRITQEKKNETLKRVSEYKFFFFVNGKNILHSWQMYNINLGSDNV